MNLKIILEPSDEGGYAAIVPALPGCISEGDTRDEALKNIREAIGLYLEPVEDDLNFSPIQKHLFSETLKIIVPAHKPIKRSTLSHILKQAHLSVSDFIKLI